MYLKSLEVIRLHKIYNYSLQFNQDITILYGENGSGKTTILSILEIILTAKIWELFDTNFERITLQGDQDYSISIFRKIDKEKGLYLEIKMSENGIDKFENIFQNTINSLEISDKNTSVFLDEIHSIYPMISEMEKVFNELYLPINRIPSTFREEKIRVNPFRGYSLSDSANINNALRRAMGLIEKENRIIESRKNRYNQDFKNQILSSSLDINTDNLSNILKNELIVDTDKIDNLQVEYFKMLDNLDVPNEHKKKIGKFLNNYQKKLPNIINSLQLNRSNSNNQEVDLMTFFFEASEIVRMKKVLPIAENLEKRLSDISSKINNFTSIVNSFFEDSMEKKELVYDNFGIPYFKIKGRTEKISLEYLSSGEKQIVILFANLILTNQYLKSKIFKNIFIADEPEISLHMLWQLKLIPNILKSRKKLQIILATHSPEIVGEFENKMFELKKERADNE
ncbi:AAA family ATPase [Streptococcus oralis]|uniref:AAA family ATPase n=1 Tax=Streptococcus oralis TaxID=1303 RepID=UPI0022849E71|nr:AAA family ATPase [Streptococcus oralis]MCY7063934.1 ATP-binding protein [Streptococcus oralis]